MSEILLVNPRRRRKAPARRKTSTRRRRSTARRRNPVRRAAKRIVRRRRNPVRARRRATRGRRRNPVGFRQAAIKGQVQTGITGALGALGLDVALAYIPLPAQLKAGIVGKLVKAGGAIALGVVANRFLNVSAANAAKLSEGALTVQFHGIGRELLGQFAPGVAMSAYLNDESDSLGYAGSGWNPSVSWAGNEGNGMDAYIDPGYNVPSMESYDSSMNY